jgi:hypothetical protein
LNLARVDGTFIASSIYLLHLNPTLMKKQILILLVATCLASSAFSQQKAQRFAVYEDQVKPSMNGKYWECMKKVKANSSQHKLAGGWTSVGFDDNSFIHLVPIANFAELDKNMFADLETKMGKEAHHAMWAEFDQCIEASKSYIITSMPELSYMNAPAGENFRDVMFWQVMPGQEKASEDLLKEWAKLYESKKTPSGFMTYKVLFGSEPGYAIVSWGKDEADAAVDFQKTKDLLGEEAGKMWGKTMAITKKYYSKRGNVLPDASYSLASTGSN